MKRPIDGLRAIGHLYILLFHYNAHFFVSDEKLNEIPIALIYFNKLILMFIFILSFVNCGVNSGIWFTNKIMKNSSFFKITIKFYFERIALILPMTYLYYIIYIVFISFSSNKDYLIKIQMKSFLSNLLFISNIVSVESNVS